MNIDLYQTAPLQQMVGEMLAQVLMKHCMPVLTKYHSSVDVLLKH